MKQIDTLNELLKKNNMQDNFEIEEYEGEYYILSLGKCKWDIKGQILEKGSYEDIVDYFKWRENYVSGNLDYTNFKMGSENKRKIKIIDIVLFIFGVATLISFILVFLGMGNYYVFIILFLWCMFNI